MRINLNIIQDLNIFLGKYYNDNIKSNNNKRIIKENYGDNKPKFIEELKRTLGSLISFSA